MLIVTSLKTFSVFLSRVGVFAAVVILGLSSGLILLEIVLRTFFAKSTFVSTELVAYGMAALSFLALGETLDRGGLIRLGTIFNYLPPTGRRVLETFICALTLAAVFVPLWYFGRSIMLNYRGGFTSGTILDVRAWIPEFGMWIGILIFWLRLLSYGLLVAVGLEEVDPEKGNKMIEAE